MNSANQPTLRDTVRFGERRASAMVSPTIAARTEPSTVARIVIFTPWIRVGMICRTKSQSQSISGPNPSADRNPSDTHSIEATRHAALQRAHAPGDDQREHEIDD